MNKKLVLVGAILILAMAIIVPLLAMDPSLPLDINENQIQETLIDSNFFGQAENQNQVAISATPDLELEADGYLLKAETSTLKLYVLENNFNIAVLDKRNNYIWYSVYPEYKTLGYSGASKFFLESGVTLEYYNLDNILIDDNKSYLSGSKYNVSITYDYETVENGLVANLSFDDLAISFQVIVWIDQDILKVKIPQEAIIEGEVEKPTLNLDGTITIRTISYRIRAIYVFPYFGSNNYNINGYSFIPDGSGALIRYDDIPKSTAYIKRIYGIDEGYRNQIGTTETAHLHPEFTASMPIFGVNHGYHQAAFLAHIKTGSSASEIHSYPFGYNSYQINTTFAKYLYRERYQITTSSNINDSFQLINTEIFPTDFEIDYYFLEGIDASYAGMAGKYREILSIDERPDREMKLDLSVIGIDYKSGLFGKNYVPMTSYAEARDIIADLLSDSVSEISLNYIGWSKGGYYDNTPVKPRLSSALGGNNAFAELTEYLTLNAIDLIVRDNPLLSFSGGLGNQIVKKMTLANFQTSVLSSRLIDSAYYRNPATMADHYDKYRIKYADLNINGFSLETVGSAAFSYRYSGVNYYREQMIDQLVSAVAELDDYELAMANVNSYLWPYLDYYLETPIESNKYAYISDSVPFIQLVLSGKTSMSSPYVNFVSDYETFALRLIEYGVMPGFLVTMQPTHKLRYTNFEYVYTSEYAIWEETIKEMYDEVYETISHVSGQAMTDHAYILPGVAKSTYGNGTIIIVNYNLDEVSTDYGLIQGRDTLVVVSP
ncbi:MAG: DUF5696 domain-containing protein [Candidatus Izemoplasmatales bacterium]|nr:DUF5696 domain-containing protein [Candidatus Izemoplasmatales bacterium]